MHIARALLCYTLGLISGWSVQRLSHFMEAAGKDQRSTTGSGGDDDENPKKAAIVAADSALRATSTESSSRSVSSHSSSTTKASAKKKSFTQLLQESGSDKYHRHHFERYYEKWMEPYRDQDGLKLLEIGAKFGYSLSLWDHYFEQAQLIMGLAYSVDANRSMERPELDKNVPGLKKVQVYWGDQSSFETMQYLQSIGPWDIIIDDGSHVPQHIVYSLYSLWSAVKPGGLYIIEDLETNYWPNGDHVYGYPLNQTGIGALPQYSAVSKIEQLQQVLVRHQIGAKELSVMPGDHDLCSVEWGMNVVVLRKCEPPDVYLKPQYFPKRYNVKKMADWIQEAKRTNPVGVP